MPPAFYLHPPHNIPDYSMTTMSNPPSFGPPSSPRYGSLPRSTQMYQQRSPSVTSQSYLSTHGFMSPSHSSSPRLQNNRSPVQNIQQIHQGINELLLAENRSLSEKVNELEQRVAMQDSELMLLRASTADIIRRLSILETDREDKKKRDERKDRTERSTVHTSPSPFSSLSMAPSTPRSISHQSISEVRTPRTSLSRSLYNPSTSKEEQTPPKPSPRPPYVNVLIGKTARGSPMRKWLSSHDMKEPNNNNQSKPSVVSPLPSSSRRSSTISPPIHNMTSSTTSLNSSNALMVPTHTATISRSMSRLGSLSRLVSSTRSLNRMSLSLSPRDPSFSASSHSLTVHIGGKNVQVPVPDDVTNIDFSSDQEPPKGKSPELDWVYSYRGKDTRHNVHHLPTGEIVYFAGTVVVLYNQEDHTQRHYTQHTSDVKSIVVHPNRILIASGQSSRHTVRRTANEHRSPVANAHQLEKVLENDQTQAHVRIWDSVSLTTLVVLGSLDSSFEKEVSCLSFSHTDSGVYLACVDESYQHILSVWEWKKKRKVAEVKSANDHSFGILFHPLTKNLIVQYGKGHFTFWNLDLSNNRLDRTAAIFEGRDKPKCILSVCFTDDTSVITGDSNGTIALWDPRNGKVMKQAHAVHPGGVFCVASTPAGHIVSAGKDKKMIEWDAKDLVRMTGPMQLPDDSGTVRVLCFVGGLQMVAGTSNNQLLHGEMKTGFRFLVEGDQSDLVSVIAHPHVNRLMTSSLDGTVRVWDTETRTPMWRKTIDDGIEGMTYSHCGSLIAIGTTSGNLIVVDANTRSTVFEVQENTESISALKFSPQNGMIVVATKSNSATLYRMESNRKFSQIARLGGLIAPITTIDWSTDAQLIRVNTTNGQLLFFKNNGESIDPRSTTNTQWASTDCIISYESSLVAHSSPGVTCVSSNPSSSLLLVGKDNGCVRLYTSPVKSTTAGYHEFRVHSSAVSSVCFVKEKMSSCGINDCSLIQWKPLD